MLSEAIPGHTISAPEVAPVGYGDSQVSQGPAQPVLNHIPTMW
jgi:hypothetical protein